MAAQQRGESLRGDRECGDLLFLFPFRRKSFSSSSSLQLLGDRTRVARRDGRYSRLGVGGVAGVGEETLRLESDRARLARVPVVRGFRSYFQRPSVQYQPWEAWCCQRPETHTAFACGRLS